jgi:hypothetical protein
MINASNERQRGFLQPRRWPDACCCCPPSSFLGVLVLEKRSLDWQRLEGRRLGERLGAPAVLLLWDWQRDRGRRLWCISREIWEVERLPSPNHRRVVWNSGWVIFGWLVEIRLSCDWIAIRVDWPELPNGSSKVTRKARQKVESEIYGEQNYKDDKSFGYKLFDTIKCSNTLRLH